MQQDAITSMFKHIDGKNLAGLQALLAEDVTYERPGHGVFVGRERVLKFYREERAVSSGEHHLEEVIVNGRTGACCGRFSGTLNNGAAVDIRFAEFYEFRKNVITRRTSYFFQGSSFSGTTL